MAIHIALLITLLETLGLSAVLLAWAKQVHGARLLVVFLFGVATWIIGNELPNWAGIETAPLAMVLLSSLPLTSAAISYADRDESDGAVGEDASGWSAYYLHALSKRTTLYAGYSHLSNEAGANYSIGNITPQAGDNHRVMMAGMRHRF